MAWMSSRSKSSPVLRVSSQAMRSASGGRDGSGGDVFEIPDRGRADDQLPRHASPPCRLDQRIAAAPIIPASGPSSASFTGSCSGWKRPGTELLTCRIQHQVPRPRRRHRRSRIHPDRRCWRGWPARRRGGGRPGDDLAGGPSPLIASSVTVRPRSGPRRALFRVPSRDPARRPPSRPLRCVPEAKSRHSRGSGSSPGREARSPDHDVPELRAGPVEPRRPSNTR